MIRKLIFSVLFTTAGMAALSSCHCDHEPAKPDIKVGWVLCSDGSIISMCDYQKSDKEGLGIVFYVNNNPEIQGKGYAVYLHDLQESQFADSLGVSQGTSCNIGTFDGNENTFALYDTKEVFSPMANATFDMWRFGQSAYIPSIAQSRILFAQLSVVNPRLEAIGGEAIPNQTPNCWYWTSTEVDGQNTAKAWLYSMMSGTFQETPKNEAHRIRPIITIND